MLTVDIFVLGDRTAELSRADRTPVQEPALGAAAPMAVVDDARADSPHAPGAWSGGCSLQRGVVACGAAGVRPAPSPRRRGRAALSRLRRCGEGQRVRRRPPHGAAVPLASGFRFSRGGAQASSV